LPISARAIGEVTEIFPLERISLALANDQAWRRGAGKESAVPHAPRTSGNDATPVDDIETAYRLYAEEISQAWKTPR
jgi:hypothetical protein